MFIFNSFHNNDRKFQLSLSVLLWSGKFGNRYLGEGGGLLPYMGYIGMCGARKYGFSATLVINRVSIFVL